MLTVSPSGPHDVADFVYFLAYSISGREIGFPWNSNFPISSNGRASMFDLRSNTYFQYSMLFVANRSAASRLYESSNRTLTALLQSMDYNFWSA